MSTLVFTTKRIKSAHFGKGASYPMLFTGKRQYNEVELSEDDGMMYNFGYMQNNLPFSAIDGYDHAEELMDYPVAILENDNLKATFFPTMGGKLWSLYDKKNNRDLIVDNPVVRPTNLSIRNAWTAGGVEYNCGVLGHHSLTCDRIYAAGYKLDDGTPVLRMYAYERIRTVIYQMDFFLPEDSPFLLSRVRIVNTSNKPVPIYWWTNIAVKQEEGARVIVPAKETYVNHLQDPIYVHEIPMFDGVDLSYATNHPEAMDHFYKIPDEKRKFEAYVTKDGCGTIHASTRRLKGRKMFVWGMSVGGQNWQKFLTNKDGENQPYVEIQAGICRTQRESMLFPPHAAWDWVEALGPINVNPEDVHGDYQKGVDTIEKWLDEHLPEAALDRFLADTKDATLQPVKAVMYGHPWGKLDTIIKTRLGYRTHCSHLDFGELGPEQMLWYDFLKNGYLEEPDPKEAPISFMVQDEWFDLLKKTVKNADSHNWFAWYQLALCYFAREDYERAEEMFEKSLCCKESTWAYHGLGNVAKAERDFGKAVKLLQKALSMNNTDITLAKETMQAALASKDYEIVKVIYSDIAEESRKDGLIQSYYAIALSHTGFLKEAKAIFEEWGSKAVVDRKEGVDAITDEYVYCLKKIAEKEGHPYQEGEEPWIPLHIDYRMHHIRLLKDEVER